MCFSDRNRFKSDFILKDIDNLINIFGDILHASV